MIKGDDTITDNSLTCELCLFVCLFSSPLPAEWNQMRINAVSCFTYVFLNHSSNILDLLSILSHSYMTPASSALPASYSHVWLWIIFMQLCSSYSYSNIWLHNNVERFLWQNCEGSPDKSRGSYFSHTACSYTVLAGPLLYSGQSSESCSSDKRPVIVGLWYHKQLTASYRPADLIGCKVIRVSQSP